MKIYFVRHGQTEYNNEGLITGQADVTLTEEGLKQAESLVLEISNDFSKVYSSDLIRCKQTAEIFKNRMGLPVIYDKRLRERDFGSLEGKKIISLDAHLKEKDINQEYDYRPYGGESVSDVKERVFSFIKDIKKIEKDKKILVITSGGVIRLLHKMQNQKAYDVIPNTSLHEFDFT